MLDNLQWQSAATGVPTGTPETLLPKAQGEAHGVGVVARPSIYDSSMLTEIGQALLLLSRLQCGTPGYEL